LCFSTIQKSDTLWMIAAETRGKGARYTGIFEVNREVVLHATKFHSGQTPRIPAK
jgi:nucleoid-associated protein YgaU